MKRKKPDPPHDFEVDDADAAFTKLEDVTRRLLAASKMQAKTKVPNKKRKRKKTNTN